MSRFSFLLNEVTSHYKKTFNEYGHTAKGANWNDQSSQYHRFQVIVDLIGRQNIENNTLADMGCGSGSFLDFCLRECLSIKKYIGYDILEEPLRSIKNNNNFDCFDKDLILSDTPTNNSDYLISSGLFNVKLKAEDFLWQQYIFSLLDLMYEKSNLGICFNLFTDKVDWKNDNLFYGCVDNFVSHFQRYKPRNIKIAEDYGLFEWTLLVEK